MRLLERKTVRDGAGPVAPTRRLALAAPVVFGLHALDEYVTGFPEWATLHFGTTSKRFYVSSHAVLMSVVVAAALIAYRRPARRGAQTALGSIAAGFVANGIFHIESTLRFRERSPGLATGLLLMIPGGVTILADLSGSAQLDHRDLATAALGGALLNAAAVGSLRLDMPTLHHD